MVDKEGALQKTLCLEPERERRHASVTSGDIFFDRDRPCVLRHQKSTITFPHSS